MDHDAHTPAADGRDLTRLAVSATLHCLTGCAIGEVLGMIIGTALGWGNLQTVALAVGLAFVFGYALTLGPVLRSGVPLAAAIQVTLAADTLSITVMEIVDNAIVLLVPGAMDAGLGALLFWGSLAVALAVAFIVTVPVNRWLIGRGKGHAVVHQIPVSDPAARFRPDASFVSAAPTRARPHDGSDQARGAVEPPAGHVHGVVTDHGGRVAP